MSTDSSNPEESEYLSTVLKNERMSTDSTNPDDSQYLATVLKNEQELHMKELRSRSSLGKSPQRVGSYNTVDLEEEDPNWNRKYETVRSDTDDNFVGGSTSRRRTNKKSLKKGPYSSPATVATSDEGFRSGKRASSSSSKHLMSDPQTELWYAKWWMCGLNSNC